MSRQIEGLNKGLQHIKRRNWRNYNVSRDENPQREEIDIPSFEGFHTQLDFKLTYGNKNQKNTVDTRVVHIISCSKTKQNNTGMIKNIAKLAYKFINCDGVRATAIMLRSNTMAHNGDLRSSR